METLPMTFTRQQVEASNAKAALRCPIHVHRNHACPICARVTEQILAPLKAPATGTDDEGKLHNEILAECKRRGWIAFHGSMAHSTFRTKGEPDFVILAPPKKGYCDYLTFPRTYLIECKTRKGKLSADQMAIHAWAEKLGHRIETVRSFEEFLKVIE